MIARQALEPKKNVVRSLVVSVRRADLDDAHALARLQDMANDGHLAAVRWQRGGSSWLDVGAQEIASDENELGFSSTVVAEVNSSVVGMLNYATNDDVRSSGRPVDRPFFNLRRAIGPGLYLRSMAVEPAFGGRGVASLLLDTATRAARVMKAEAVGVIVHERNERLIAHYISRGYVSVAEEQVVRHHSYPTGTKLVALRLPLGEHSR